MKHGGFLVEWGMLRKPRSPNWVILLITVQWELTWVNIDIYL